MVGFLYLTKGVTCAIEVGMLLTLADFNNARRVWTEWHACHAYSLGMTWSLSLQVSSVTIMPDTCNNCRNTGKLKNGKTFGIKHLAKGKEDVPGPIYSIGCSTLGIAANDKTDRKSLSQSTILL